MLPDQSQLVTRHSVGSNGASYADPLLFEGEFTRWLTLDQRQIPAGDNADVGERVAAYDGALLNEFFATLPERIAFWTKKRNEALAKNSARRHAPLPAPRSSIDAPVVAVETNGTSDIAAYIERLEWSACCRSDAAFLALNGHQQFHVVAIALRYGIDSANRFLHGSAAYWSDDDMAVAVRADRDLEFLIYLQRGSAVEFRSGPNSPS